MTIKDGEPRTSTSTFTQLLSSVLQFCFTTTETMMTKQGRGTQDGQPQLSHSSWALFFSFALRPLRPWWLNRDGEPRTATSTVTQLLSSVLQFCFTTTETMMTKQGRGTQDGHLNCHTAPELCTLQVPCRFTSTETFRTGPRRPPRLEAHAAPELWQQQFESSSVLLYLHRVSSDY